MDYLSAWFYIPIPIIFFSFAQKTNDEKSNNFYGRMAFLLIWLFAVCRYNFGNDYPSYWASVAGQSAHDIGYHKKDLEVISNYIIRFVYDIHFPPLLFIIFSSISLAGYYFLIKRYAKCQALSWYFYFTYPMLFFQDCSTLRQSGAMAMFCMAFPFLDKGKYCKSFIILILGLLFHSSALVCFLIILLPLFKRFGLLSNIILFSFSFVGGRIVENFVFNYIVSLGVAEGYMYYIDNKFGGLNSLQYTLYAINVANFILYKSLCRDNPVNRYLVTLVNIGICMYNLLSFESQSAIRTCAFFLVFEIIIISSYKTIIAHRLKSVSSANFLLVFFMFILQLTLVVIYINAFNNRVLDSAVYSPYQFWINHI